MFDIMTREFVSNEEGVKSKNLLLVWKYKLLII